MRNLATINVSNAIKKVLEDEGYRIQTVVNQAAEESAQELVQELKNSSPRRTGKYSRSWTASAGKTIGSSFKSYVVHNAKHYQLTHLLEKGHVIRSGGYARAIPHIASATDRIAEKFEKRIIDGVKRGD